eukprot:3334035-Rhodomonas_salina.1
MSARDDYSARARIYSVPSPLLIVSVFHNDLSNNNLIFFTLKFKLVTSQVRRWYLSESVSLDAASSQWSSLRQTVWSENYDLETRLRVCVCTSISRLQVDSDRASSSAPPQRPGFLPS